MCSAYGSLACSNLPFSIHMFSTCFEMRFPSPFESSVGAFSCCRTIYENKNENHRWGKALSFKNAFDYSSALSNAYSTVHNNNLYYLPKKNKYIMIGTNPQMQSDIKLRKTTQRRLNMRLRCNQSRRWGGEGV